MRERWSHQWRPLSSPKHPPSVIVTGILVTTEVPIGCGPAWVRREDSGESRAWGRLRRRSDVETSRLLWIWAECIDIEIRDHMQEILRSKFHCTIALNRFGAFGQTCVIRAVGGSPCSLRATTSEVTGWDGVDVVVDC
ncbi:hypothetical protein GW17_00060299 [Ensete ventricosum]|nr:hypothetical protein GW17_00060299 [Ensete ventricosum]